MDGQSRNSGSGHGRSGGGSRGGRGRGRNNTVTNSGARVYRPSRQRGRGTSSRTPEPITTSTRASPSLPHRGPVQPMGQATTIGTSQGSPPRPNAGSGSLASAGDGVLSGFTKIGDAGDIVGAPIYVRVEWDAKMERPSISQHSRLAKVQPDASYLDTIFKSALKDFETSVHYYFQLNSKGEVRAYRQI